MKLTDVQIGSYCSAAGFKGQGLVTAIAIVLAESNGNTLARNTANNHPPSVDRGMFQINSYWHDEVSNSQAVDPAMSAAAAYRISHEGTDWHEWSTYVSGTYERFLARGRAAAAALTPGLVTVKAGDTLTSIAERAHVTLARLRTLNPTLFDVRHRNGDLIRPGERVRLR